MNCLKGLYSGAAPLSEQTFNYFLSLDLPIQVQNLLIQVYHHHKDLQMWIYDGFCILFLLNIMFIYSKDSVL